MLNDFSDNIGIFQELLDDFGHFMNLEQRRRELVEQRLRDVEEGRARQEQARLAVESAIAEAGEGRVLPEPVQDLLSEPWTKFLQWTYLRHGPDSEEWERACGLTRQLTWSVDPRPYESDTRRMMLRHIPAVVDGIREGLQTISWDPFAADRMIRDLELVHVDTLQNVVVAFRDPETSKQVEARAAEPVAQAPAETDSDMLVHEAPPEIAGKVSEVAEAAVAADEVDAVASRWLEQAQSLRVGSWVEIVRGESKLRCKLAAVIRATGKYIFVNRSAQRSLSTICRRWPGL